MKLQLYNLYLEHREAGRKREATDAIRDFVASFKRESDREEWVRQFLEHGVYGHRIRHEIYAQLVFPVLLDGYARRSFWSISWLAKTVSNVYADPSLHAQIGFKGERQLFREAFELHQSDEMRDRLLSAHLSEFEYCAHEWPAGILYGTDGATAEECREILEDLDFARALDDGTNETFLNEFEQKVHEYRQRLSSST